MHTITLHRARLLGALVLSLMSSAPARADDMRAQVSCSPAPCVLPNVLAAAHAGYLRLGAQLSVNPLNTNAMVITGYSASDCESTLITHVSLDRGSTWRTTCMPEGMGRYTDPAPISAYDHAGRLHLVTTRPGIPTPPALLNTSTDNGLSFGTTVEAVPAFLGTIDWLTLAVDRGTDSPYRGTLYIASTHSHRDGVRVLSSQVVVSQSRDGGATWEHRPVGALHSYPAAVWASGLAVGRTGKVYLAYQSCPTTSCYGSPGTVFVQHSIDGGRSWFHPVAAMAYKTTRNLTAPSIALDNSTGTFGGSVYLTMETRQTTSASTNVVVVTSADGTSWSTPFYLALKYPGERRSPQVRVSARGEAGISWLDSRRNTNAHPYYYDLYAIFSRDRFRTASEEARLSTSLAAEYDWTIVGTGSDWGGNTLFVVSDALRDGFPIAQEWLVGASRAK